MIGFIEDSARGAAIDLRREGVRKRVIGAVGTFGQWPRDRIELFVADVAADAALRAAAAAMCSASTRQMLANNSPRAGIAADALDAYGELRSHRAASGSKLRSMDASVACHR